MQVLLFLKIMTNLSKSSKIPQSCSHWMAAAGSDGDGRRVQLEGEGPHSSHLFASSRETAAVPPSCHHASVWLNVTPHLADALAQACWSWAQKGARTQTVSGREKDSNELLKKRIRQSKMI